METRGPAIFSDDLAADVRADYTDLIGQGLPSAEATQRLINAHLPDTDPDDGSVFWLALAATQWKLGRLEERVKLRALKLIDADTNLQRWEREAGPAQARKRHTVLQALKQQLLTPTPPAKRVSPRYVQATDFQVGDVVSYRLRSGHFALLKVVDHHTDRGGRVPVVEVLDWVGDQAPSREAIAKLPARLPTTSDKRITPQFMLARWSKTDYPSECLMLVARQVPVPSVRITGGGLDWWKRLDDRLGHGFNLI